MHSCPLFLSARFTISFNPVRSFLASFAVLPNCSPLPRGCTVHLVAANCSIPGFHIQKFLASWFPDSCVPGASYRDGDAAGDAAGAASLVEISCFNGDFLRTCCSVLVNLLDVAATCLGGGATSCRRASS